MSLSMDGVIAGTVTTDGDAPVPFHGWLELMDALERLREAAEADRRSAA